MTRLRKVAITGLLLVSFASFCYGGTITGSRTGASGSRTGTITGSRTGTITGSRTGTITGSRLGTGSVVGSFDTIYNEFLFRLVSVMLNGGLWASSDEIGHFDSSAFKDLSRCLKASVLPSLLLVVSNVCAYRRYRMNSSYCINYFALCDNIPDANTLRGFIFPVE